MSKPDPAYKVASLTGDLVFEAAVEGNFDGDIIFRAGGAERTRIKSDGTGTGWSNVLGGSLPVIPESYGAAGDGVTNDAAALQAMFNAIPATGGWVHLPRKYKTLTGITVPNRTKITGNGGLDSAFNQTSGIVCPTDGIDALTINAHGSVLRDFAITYTGGSRATSGSGLRVAFGDFTRIDGVDVDAFWNTLQFDRGWYYQISNSKFFDAANYGIYLRNTESGGADHGDQGITNCVISKVRDTTAGGTAVRWESGGGLRFFGNKINAGTQVGFPIGNIWWDYGLALVADDGVSTGVFPISGNSIETANIASIFVGTMGSNTGYLAKIAITGNEIAPFGTNADGVVFSPGAVWNFTDHIVSANVIRDVGSGHKCIWMKNVDGFKLGPNKMRGTYHNFIDAGCTNFDIDASSAGAGGIVVYNSNADNGNNGWSSRPIQDSRAITSLATGASVPCWDIDMTNMNSGCMVEVTVSGRLVGTVAGPAVRTKQFFIAATAGVPVVDAAIVDQHHGTSTLDITATVSGAKVTLAVTQADGGTTTFRGTIAVKVTGYIFNLATR